MCADKPFAITIKGDIVDQLSFIYNADKRNIHMSYSYDPLSEHIAPYIDTLALLQLLHVLLSLHKTQKEPVLSQKKW